MSKASTTVHHGLISALTDRAKDATKGNNMFVHRFSSLQTTFHNRSYVEESKVDEMFTIVGNSQDIEDVTELTIVTLTLTMIHSTCPNKFCKASSIQDGSFKITGNNLAIKFWTESNNYVHRSKNTRTSCPSESITESKMDNAIYVRTTTKFLTTCCRALITYHDTFNI